jgi:hypothetical protein
VALLKRVKSARSQTRGHLIAPQEIEVRDGIGRAEQVEQKTFHFEADSPFGATEHENIIRLQAI